MGVCTCVCVCVCVEGSACPVLSSKWCWKQALATSQGEC